MKENPDLAPAADVAASANYRISRAEITAARKAAEPPPKRRRKLLDVLKAARDIGASRVKIDGYEIDLDPQGAEARVNDFDRPPNNTAIKRPRK